MTLLLDLGNTRLKWAWLDGERLDGFGALAHGEDGWLDRLAAAWRGQPAPAQAWLAAVASDTAAAAVSRLIHATWPGCILHRVASPAAAGGVVNAYREPARLGVDRFLAMLGARARFNTAAVVAGCGTALAIDLVDAAGRHHGGVIAPSARRMREAVLATTARVLPQGESPPAGLGRSTEEGLDSGCWLAAAALVDRIVDDAAARLGQLPALLLHGGDAAAIAALLRHRATIAPELVLEGLARWAVLPRP
jgi:type III pantothenate kinase